LDKYKTCTSAEHVAAMQDAILAELEHSYQESRKEKDASGSTEDLLVPNPNHATRVPEDAESGEEGDEA
jgi:pre-rRNA-processing protein TSR3